MRAVIQSRVRTARWSASSRQATSTSFKAENRSAKVGCGVDTRDVVRVVTGMILVRKKKELRFIFVPCGKGEKDCNIWCKGGSDEESSRLSRSGEETMHMCGLNDEGMEKGINKFPRISLQESLRTARI